MFYFNRKKSIYLDYASITPVDSRVLRVMNKTMDGLWHNPSALYKGGVQAHKAISGARTQVARFFGVHSDEIIFTGSGTESDNLALIGTVKAFRSEHPEKTPHIITTPIEHSAILETCKALEKEGCRISYVPVDQGGIVILSELKKMIDGDTAIVSIQYANNEIGVIQPIQEIAKIIRHFKRHREEESSFPLFHTDAVQAIQYLPVRIETLGVDLLSANGSKIYGPRGIGILFKKRSAVLDPILFGGNQEFGLRPGTEALDRIVGIAEALRIVEEMKDSEVERLSAIREYAFSRITESFPSCLINGHETLRLPNNINISIPEYDSEFLVLELDARGISVSSKSACKSDEPYPSYVIQVIRPDSKDQAGSLRITLGRETEKSDIDALISALLSIHTKQSRLSN